VERPERIHACVLGASTAYIRIGSRHAGGKYPPHPDRDAPPPPFKIRKTTRSIPLNYSAVAQVHGQKWMEELQIMCDSAEGKLAMNGKELVRPIGYGKDEGGNPLPKLHEGDLYLCSESLDALQGCLGGVCEAVDTVFSPDKTNRAFVCIRPPGHHCSSNLPSGFCWLNNVHVGIAHAAMAQGLTHAAIIDFDLHHGDGSQAIAWDHNRKAAGNLPKNASPYSKTPIGYFSLHDINSYPCEWGDEEKIKNASLCVENAHGQSIWNVHLEPWKNHTDFWRLYESRYSLLLDKTRIFLRHHTAIINSRNNSTKAKAAIFLSAGFDASEWEGAGMQRHKVNVPTDFYARFTSDVVKLAEEEGLGVGGRVISVLEGGYSDRALTSGVLSHLCGLTYDSVDDNLQSKSVQTSLAAAMAMAKQMGTLSMSQPANRDTSTIEHSAAGIAYNPDWWTHHHLKALEVLVNPVPEGPTKPTDKVGGNYSSPTQASTAKMTDPARERRSLSGLAEARASTEPESVQPPPDVDWALASYELSRLLIPNDRQTLSCRHDELNAEATKVRRERQSTIGLPSNDTLSAADQRMQLRDRRAKTPAASEIVKGAPKADRRRTIAAVADLPDQEFLQNGSRAVDVGIANTRPRRRSSAGSSIMSAFEGMNLNDRGSQPPEANAVTSRGKIAPNHNDTRIPAMSAKTAKVPVQKKVKQLPMKKAQPTKTKTSPRKTESTPPVPKLPSVIAQTTDGSFDEERGTRSDEAQPSVNRMDSANSASGADDDLDVIALGMRKMKINLKVPSPEENAAREKKVAAEKDKLKKSRVSRKPAVPKSAKAPPPKKDNRSSSTALTVPSSTAETSTADERNGVPIDVVSSLMSAQQPPHPGQNAERPATGNDYIPTPNIAHAEPPVQASIPAPVPAPVETESMAPTDITIDDSQIAPMRSSSKGPQASSTETEPGFFSPPLPLHAQLNTWSESQPSGAPASAPATAKKTRADLPRFTASSPIPFAKVDNNIPSTDLAKADKDSAPNPSNSDPPSATAFHHAAVSSDLDPNEQRQAKENAASETNPSVKYPGITTTTVDPSIWEVPETPRH
jgi:histone deacetylase HOS3